MSFREEKNIFYIYFQIIKAYKDFMQDSLQGFGLTPAEIDVLTFLVNNRGEKITASEISVSRGLSKGSVSLAVTELKDKKMIKTEENPKDGRSVYLEVTGEEAELLRAIEGLNEKFKNRLIKDLDPSQLNLFLRVNNKMLANIKDVAKE